ncbi:MULTISPECIES: ester cyclase [Paenibacillus]|uniref:ester cyclase n=1 Tax=Paenibacillus TaxID=44249 RepID=UPI0022B8C822|nr:ester cyclase [Paenibacillus caseinilyticus]MCZ8520476.1 ester cyclase [Paenibacillus caseinilyticus]
MNAIEQKNADVVAAFIGDRSNQSLLDRTDQFFAGQLAEAFVDRHYTVAELLTQGEKVIARIFMSGTHVGPFAGLAPTGKTVQATQFREFRLADGMIAEHRGWFDTATLLPQIQSQ